MSVLIKGMKMPKEGEYRMTLYVCDDGYAYMDVDSFPVDEDRFDAVPVLAIEDLPTVAPVKHGKWILQDTSYWRATHAGDVQVNRANLKCSFCGWKNHDRKDYNYCPNCGAKMERERRMSYRLIDSNALVLKYPEVNDMPCIFVDLPDGLDGKHYQVIPEDVQTIISNSIDMCRWMKRSEG